MENITSILSEYNKASHRIQEKSILSVNVKEKLSELVTRRMRELDLSKAEVARLTKLSRGYIGNIANKTAPTESGQYNLSPETVVVFAKVLQISESEILSAMNYLSETKQILPHELAIMDFDGFDDQDLKEIADFISFKRSQMSK